MFKIYNFYSSLGCLPRTKTNKRKMLKEFLRKLRWCSTLVHRTVPCKIKYLTKANGEGWWKTYTLYSRSFFYFILLIMFYSFLQPDIILLMREMENYLEKIYICIYHETTLNIYLRTLIRNFYKMKTSPENCLSNLWGAASKSHR